MLKTMTSRAMWAVLACMMSASAHAFAENSRRVDIPGGDLIAALQVLAQQSGAEFVYSIDQLKGVKTGGVHGEFTTETAAAKLLEGTKLKLTVHQSGAMLIAFPTAASTQGVVRGEGDQGNSPGSKSASGQTLRVAQVDQGTTRNSSTESKASQDSLEEVVVTAQKRRENLQDVPISVSALSAEQLDLSGTTNTMDLSTVVPGLTSQRSGISFQPRLRGIGAGSNGPGIENPVALVVDGVYYGSQFLGLDDLADAEQVSVLKGPQGTLFGRNATAGVIQITTTDPTEDFHGDIRTELDNYLTSRSNVYVTGGLSDNVAGNLSLGYTTQGRAWGENLFDGEDIHTIKHDISARSKWIYSGEDTMIRLNFDYTDREATDLNTRPVPGTEPLFPGFPQTSNIYDIDSPPGNLSKLIYGGISLTVDHDMSFAHFISITAYRRSKVNDFFWASPTSIPAEGIGQVADNSQFTQEFQLVSPHTETFNWVTGLYYFHAEDTANPVSLVFGGPLAPTPLSLGQANVFSTSIVNSVAPYGQATLQVAPNTNLTAGLRYTYEHRYFGFQETGALVNGTDLGELPVAPYDPILAYRKLTWRLSLDHKFTPDFLGFISDNRGFKSGGFSPFSASNPPYQPEILDAYEAGIKSEWLDHKLRANASSFYYNYTNLQESAYNASEDAVIVYNAANARIYGLDVDSEIKISDLRLSAGAELLHSAFTSFPNAVLSSPLPGGGVTTRIGSATGNQLPYAPRIVVDLTADYIFQLPSGSLDAAVTTSINGGYRTEPDNVLRQDAFTLINSSLSWVPLGGHLKLSIFGKNLLDKVVATYLFTSAPFGYDGFYENPPRTFGGSVSYSFGRN
jgi:iron complex outermembrane recepter protein